MNPSFNQFQTTHPELMIVSFLFVGIFLILLNYTNFGINSPLNYIIAAASTMNQSFLLSCTIRTTYEWQEYAEAYFATVVIFGVTACLTRYTFLLKSHFKEDFEF